MEGAVPQRAPAEGLEQERGVARAGQRRTAESTSIHLTISAVVRLIQLFRSMASVRRW